VLPLELGIHINVHVLIIHTLLFLPLWQSLVLVFIVKLIVDHGGHSHIESIDLRSLTRRQGSRLGLGLVGVFVLANSSRRHEPKLDGVEHKPRLGRWRSLYLLPQSTLSTLVDTFLLSIRILFSKIHT
jgi:hypothetical protein